MISEWLIAVFLTVLGTIAALGSGYGVVVVLGALFQAAKVRWKFTAVIIPYVFCISVCFFILVHFVHGLVFR